MSLFDCIQAAMEGKEMDPRRGVEAQQLFNDLRADYAQRVGTDAANAAAAEDVKKIMAARAGEKRRLTLLRLQAARRNGQLMANHKTLRGQANPADALRIFITGDEVSAIPGIVPIAKSLKGFYHAELDKVLSSFSRNLVGSVRNKALLADMTRAMFGQETKNAAAKEMAEASRKVLDRARRDFNAAGGNIGEIENYGLPMHHHAGKIEAAKFEAWRDFVWDKLDWGRIVDRTTEKPFAMKGGLPAKGSRADEFLNEIYRSITTDGWSKREASFMDRGLSVSSRRGTSRILHFKDGDAWLDYNGRFGSEDPFTNLVTALDGYARDTASMRVLGPNPAAGITYLGQLAVKTAEEAPWGKDRASSVTEAKKAARKAAVMLDLHSGAAQQPVDDMLAGFLSGVRAVLVSAQLGSAAVSAVTDVGFQAAAARKVGMGGSRVMARLFTELKSSPVRAVRMGLIADQMANVGAAQARYMGEVFTPERAARLSDFVMRASGLSKWTEAGRHAFQLEFMGFLADNAALPFDRINPALKLVLDRKGFTAADWDVIRKTELHDEDGATFLVPHELRARDDIAPEQADDLAVRLMSVIHEQTEFAIPSASLEGQAIFFDQTRPGTLIGELARSGFMYKTFGMSVLYNQIRRTMSYEGKWSRAAYGASMMAMVTVMGAVSLQLKELVKGRDPRPMDSPEFLGAAVLQGGGFGIFGDFLSSESNRFGGGIESTLAGPMFGAAGDLISLGITGTKAAFGNEDVKFGRELSGFLRYNTPVTGIWYWSSAFQRGLFDNLQKMMDPEAERAWRDAEKRRVRDYRNPAWWGPGQALPRRSPDLGNVRG
jgi:hypothetical protein